MDRSRWAPFTYRAIYGRLRHEGFVAGEGLRGHWTNVPSAIRRIRKKFRAVDAGFDEIQNCEAVGYCWRKPEERAMKGAPNDMLSVYLAKVDEFEVSRAVDEICAAERIAQRRLPLDHGLGWRDHGSICHVAWVPEDQHLPGSFAPSTPGKGFRPRSR